MTSLVGTELTEHLVWWQALVGIELTEHLVWWRALVGILALLGIHVQIQQTVCIHVCMVYLTALSVFQFIRIVGWLLNSLYGTIPAFALRDWEKQRKFSATADSLHFWIDELPNKNMLC
jgi:hypothetical protein